MGADASGPGQDDADEVGGPAADAVVAPDTDENAVVDAIVDEDTDSTVPIVVSPADPGSVPPGSPPRMPTRASADRPEQGRGTAPEVAAPPAARIGGADVDAKSTDSRGGGSSGDGVTDGRSAAAGAAEGNPGASGPNTDQPADSSPADPDPTGAQPGSVVPQPDSADRKPDPVGSELEPTSRPAVGGGALVRRPARRLLRVGRFQVLAAVLLGALGFGLIVQARQTQSQDLSALSQSELVRILDDVSGQSERLDAEAEDLEATRNELRSGTDRAAAAEEATRERLEVLGILAGTDQAQGSGIVLRIADPQKLVDAADILDTVQELRDAGAEAIQIGRVRVVASTSFTAAPTGGAVVVDGTQLSPPYRILAIGDPDTMESALNIPGGVLETLHQVGASGTVHRRQDLTVSAVRQVTTPTYAVPSTEEPED